MLKLQEMVKVDVWFFQNLRVAKKHSSLFATLREKNTGVSCHVNRYVWT